MATILVNGALGLLPVLVFLAVLVQSESFKLVRVRFVLALVAAGAAAALAAYYAEAAIMRRAAIEPAQFARFYGPLLEEGMKAAIVVALIRLDRIGFVFDAAIAGFAIGAGFAVVENYFYLNVIGTDHPAVWVVRGFGTAIMHGGATAVFAVLAHLLTPEEGEAGLLRLAPGFAAGLLLHVGFNQFLAYPVASTLVMFVGLAAALGLVFRRETKSIDHWLTIDFGRHERLLREIRSGEFGPHALGKMFDALHARFPAVQIAEIVRYVELHTELVLAAERVLQAREKGLEFDVNDEVKRKLAHYHEIETEIGRAVRLALSRHLHFTRHEFFELFMLDRDAALATRTTQDGEV